MNGDNTLNHAQNHAAHFGLPKNIFLIIAALVSFSLWLASTLNTPRKLDNIETRLQHAENNYASMEAQINSASQDIRDIKNFLMRGRQ
ncbi:MAG: hypothetical protein LBI01_03120 [Elusimicrobium sp.]|jgi:outer membrane murein-binding lipoprotein Lpp|nr:hypothetical protein [Elusimicrobium sp.]